MPIIAHIDMDAFFAAVEERDKPYLKGMPIVIGADPDGGKGRGVVSTANYVARAYGIGSAMPIREAWRRSEKAKKEGKQEVIFITPKLRRYSKISKEVFRIVKKYAREIERTSVDEGYVILKKVNDYTEAKKIAQKLKAEIKKKTKLTCSIGIGPNKLVAKIASDLDKPNGLTVIPQEEVLSVLAPLPIRAIPGIGPKAAMKLRRIRVDTIRKLRELSKEKLLTLFGKWGHDLYKKARGQGMVTLSTRGVPKSVGVHDTFELDLTRMQELMDRMRLISEEVFSRFKAEGFLSFKTVVVTVRYDDFETKQRMLTLKEVAYDADSLERSAIKLLLPFLDTSENPKKKPIRMLGLRVEKLSKEYAYTQTALFE